MRRLLPVLCLAVLAAGCSGLGVRNQDAATVNGVGIPTDRLSEMTKAQLGQQQSQSTQQGQQQSQDIEGATRQALEGLIQFQLVLDGAKKEGVAIQESDVDARMEQLKQQVAAQGQNYEELLQTRQISEEVLRTQQRVQLAVDLVAVKLVPYSPDAQLRQTLDQRKDDFLEVHVRHVLVKDKAKADAVRQELASGGDWAAVAKERSIDTQSKDKAGDLGFNAKGATVKPFETAEFKLAGQGDCKGKSSGSCESPISQPVKTQFGYHVLQVVGVRLPKLDNELRAKLEPAIKDRRQQAVQRWFDEQVKGAEVVINPRFGAWDAENGKVIDRETAPGAGPTTTAGIGGPTTIAP
ncbi:MAG TPA: SurA N-terminal domain-containing protein [Actinomycetota bacterium]|nr:SurA N-terminal domain-containing protein [Actinomycetota bacterium]